MNKPICATLVPIFNHLDHESLVKISEITTHHHYKKGSILYSPNKTGQLVIIVKGRAKVYQVHPSGKEILLRILEQGNFIGEETLFGVENNDTWAEVLVDSLVCMISQKDLATLLQTYPSIALALLKQYHHRLIEMEHLASTIKIESVETRLSLYLLDLSKAQKSNCVILPFYFKELANFLGTTPETLSRKISDFEKKGWIKRKGRAITLLNKEGFK